MNVEFIEALEDLERQRGIDKDTLLEAIEAALVAAFRRHFGTAQNVAVRIDRETGEIRVVAEETLLCAVAPHHPGRQHVVEAQQVPAAGVGIEGVDDRPSERVADDRHRLDALVLDRVEQLVDVEGTRRQRDDAASLQQRAERRHAPGGVHERARR